jgi:phosphoglycolate phosphatase-like HAD superfamily hydrolase
VSAPHNTASLVERINNGAVATKARVALFDFDGTLSLIRAGWVDVMVPMMVEILAALKSGETEEQLRAVVQEYVSRLTGKQTIYQMIALAEEVEKRGGKPEDPLKYKYMYLERLMDRIRHRIEALRAGKADPEQYLVPGSRALLEALRERGLRMFLASGTDDLYVKDEARLLRVDHYFDGGVYGALDDYKSFSKAILIQRIIQNAGVKGEEFLGFGDGYVEIENVKQVGGVAVGVATDEPKCETIDEWKRKRLIGVGADYIVPNYLGREELFSMLFPS